MPLGYLTRLKARRPKPTIDVVIEKAVNAFYDLIEYDIDGAKQKDMDKAFDFLEECEEDGIKNSKWDGTRKLFLKTLTNILMKNSGEVTNSVVNEGDEEDETEKSNQEKKETDDSSLSLDRKAEPSDEESIVLVTEKSTVRTEANMSGLVSTQKEETLTVANEEESRKKPSLFAAMLAALTPSRHSKTPTLPQKNVNRKDINVTPKLNNCDQEFNTSNELDDSIVCLGSVKKSLITIEDSPLRIPSSLPPSDVQETPKSTPDYAQIRNKLHRVPSSPVEQKFPRLQTLPPLTNITVDYSNVSMEMSTPSPPKLKRRLTPMPRSLFGMRK